MTTEKDDLEWNGKWLKVKIEFVLNAGNISETGDNMEMIYHYCAADTFMSIMNSGVLWLCDLTDSNDEEEMSRTFNEIWTKIKNRLRNTDLNRKLLDEIIERVDKRNTIVTAHLN